MKWLIATTAGTPNFCDVLDVAQQVGDADLDRIDVLGLPRSALADAAVHLERAHGGDDHDGGRA